MLFFFVFKQRLLAPLAPLLGHTSCCCSAGLSHHARHLAELWQLWALTAGSAWRAGVSASDPAVHTASQEIESLFLATERQGLEGKILGIDSEAGKWRCIHCIQLMFMLTCGP